MGKCYPFPSFATRRHISHDVSVGIRHGNPKPTSHLNSRVMLADLKTPVVKAQIGAFS